MTRLSETILAAMALAYPTLAARQLAVRTYAPAVKQASSADAVSSHVLTLKKSNKAAKSAGYLSSLRTGIVSSSSNYSYGAEPVDNLLSEEYVAEIEWDGTPVEVIIDTGSSDTWLVQAGFTCVDVDGNVQSVSVHPASSSPKVPRYWAHSHIFYRRQIATLARSLMAPSMKAQSRMSISTLSMAMASFSQACSAMRTSLWLELRSITSKWL